jgi:DNA-binding PadR family transcriptional regulator
VYRGDLNTNAGYGSQLNQSNASIEVVRRNWYSGRCQRSNKIYPIAMNEKLNQELYIGLVRLHVLHLATETPIFGLGIIEELGRHGYHLGRGTIYPLLHSMERRGWLRATARLVNGRKRKIYNATATGRKASEQARIRVRELYRFPDTSFSRGAAQRDASLAAQ